MLLGCCNQLLLLLLLLFCEREKERAKMGERGREGERDIEVDR